MSLDMLIQHLRRSLMIFGDDTSEQALEMIENNRNLAFSRYSLGNDINFGLIESFASRCYYARLFLETMKFEDIDFLENTCKNQTANDMFLELLRLYNLLRNMTNYFDALDMNIASRDYFQAYTRTLKIANDLINALKEDIIDDEVYKELVNTLLDVYDVEITQSRDAAKSTLEDAITYEDLFLFESAFSDMGMLRLDAMGLTSSELEVILKRIGCRLDLISEDLSNEILKKISPLLFIHMDSEMDLDEKNEILKKRVHERI